MVRAVRVEPDSEGSSSLPARRLVRDVVIYGSGGVGLQLLLFVTLPVFSRFFGPAEFGVIESLTTLTAALVIVVTLGLDSASQRSYFDYGDDQPVERRAVLSTAFWALLLASTLVTLVAALASRRMADLFFGEPVFVTALVLVVVTIPTLVLRNFFLEIMRVRHQPSAYSLVSVFGGIFPVGIALYLVVVHDAGITGYYLGLLVGGGAALVAGYAIVRRWIALELDFRELKVMLAYGLPLVPVAASSWVLQLADRFFVLRYTSRSELGLYGMGARLSNLLLLAVTAFALAWSPLMLETHRRDPSAERQLRARALLYVAVVLSLGAVVVSVFAREFFLTVTPPSFADAYLVVGLLSGSVVAFGLTAVTMSSITLARKTMYFARYAMYAAAVNIALNFLFIPPWGMVGAALATLVSYGFLAAAYHRRAESIDPAPFDDRRLAIILATAAAVIAAGTFLILEPLWLSVLVKLPLVLIFPAVLWLSGVIDAQGLALARRTAAELVSRGETAP